MTLKEKIEKHFKTEKEIHKELGYDEGYTVLPLDPQFGDYWYLDDDTVYHQSEPMTQEQMENCDAVYASEIYYSRHIKNAVCRADGVTAIAVDTNCDFNKFLMLFDNAKEQKLED